MTVAKGKKKQINIKKKSRVCVCVVAAIKLSEVCEIGGFLLLREKENKNEYTIR